MSCLTRPLTPGAFHEGKGGSGQSAGRPWHPRRGSWPIVDLGGRTHVRELRGLFLTCPHVPHATPLHTPFSTPAPPLHFLFLPDCLQFSPQFSSWLRHHLLQEAFPESPQSYSSLRPHCNCSYSALNKYSLNEQVNPHFITKETEVLHLPPPPPNFDQPTPTPQIPTKMSIPRVLSWTSRLGHCYFLFP